MRTEIKLINIVMHGILMGNLSFYIAEFIQISHCPKYNMRRSNYGYYVCERIHPNRTKLFTVPWELMSFSPHDREFIIGVPRSLLLTAAGYDTLKEVMANTDFHWLGGVFPFFSDKPGLEAKRKEQNEWDIEDAKKRREEM
jgi:hypothetical protein